MNIRVRFLALVIAGVLASTLAPALTVQAQRAFSHGAVVALQDTPHLWIADEQGILHWAGDTRALANKHVRWDSRTEVTLAQLQQFERGDPWLTAGFIKAGDPIYLVKWETDWSKPRLLQVQSIGDLELFGISDSNYGRLVLARSAWETRHGLSAAGLRRDTLPAVIAQAIPTTAAAPADQGHLGSFPPKPHAHITFTLPAGWRRNLVAGWDWNLNGQVLVTAPYATVPRTAAHGPETSEDLAPFYDTVPGKIAIVPWITALPREGYEDHALPDILRKHLELDRSYWHWTHLALDRSTELTVAEIVATTQELTVAGVPALSVDYRARESNGSGSERRLIVLRRGNVFWILEIAGYTRDAFRRYQDDLNTIIGSIEFHY